jgi:hypothetical protein
VERIDLQLNRGGKIAVRNARQQDLADDHIAAGKQNGGGNMRRAELFQEGVELRTPFSGGPVGVVKNSRRT